MKVLVACEFSGVVRDAFLAVGCDAWSCDIDPCESEQSKHMQCDVRDILNLDWDLMIAHPPCTYLCNSGVRWIDEQPLRKSKMLQGAAFFRTLLESPIPRIAVENPTPHHYAVTAIGRQYDKRFQPWHFGDLESKAICLWLRRLDFDVPKVRKPMGVKASTHNESPGPNRSKNRSRFFSGVAKAMAEQWGQL